MSSTSRRNDPTRLPVENQRAPSWWGRPRHILLLALALSLLVHLIVAVIVRWPRNAPVPTEIVRIGPPVIVAHRTPAPPRPRVTVTPHPQARPALQPVNVAHLTPHTTGTPTAAALAAASPANVPAPRESIAPSPAASADCAQTDTPVRVTHLPDVPEIPAAARAARATGIARVALTITAGADIASAAIAQSSGDPQLDAIALQMAQHATYQPAQSHCTPKTSTYTLSIKFISW